MSYRPSSKPPKGAWARHLHEQRRLRDLSQTQAFELVYERIGWSPKSRTAYVAIDMGDRKPKPDEVTVLGAEFGWPPDPIDLEPETDEGLVAAIRDQTAAINRLVDRLEGLASGAIREGVLDALREAAEAQAAAKSRASQPLGRST